MHYISNPCSQLSHRGCSNITVTASEDKLLFESDAIFKLVADVDCLRIESPPMVVCSGGKVMNFARNGIWVSGKSVCVSGTISGSMSMAMANCLSMACAKMIKPNPKQFTSRPNFQQEVDCEPEQIQRN
jgi:hypothetical protein